MKEDDPLLCTTLATVALFHCFDARAATSTEKLSNVYPQQSGSQGVP
jgi:hypothetical protein